MLFFVVVFIVVSFIFPQPNLCDSKIDFIVDKSILGLLTSPASNTNGERTYEGGIEDPWWRTSVALRGSSERTRIRDVFETLTPFACLPTTQSNVSFEISQAPLKIKKLFWNFVKPFLKFEIKIINKIFL